MCVSKARQVCCVGMPLVVCVSQLLWPSLQPIESRDKQSGVKDLRGKLNAKSSDLKSPSSSLKSLSLSNVKSPKPPATTGNKEECLQIALPLVEK